MDLAGRWSRIESSRWYRPVMAGLALDHPRLRGRSCAGCRGHRPPTWRVGADLTLYVDADEPLARGWLVRSRAPAGGALPDHRRRHPLSADDDPLFMAFLVLPRFLFWAIPLAVVAWAVVRYPSRPLDVAAHGPRGSPYIPTTVKIVHFNPFIWASGRGRARDSSTAGHPSSSSIKPSLAPFALVGIRHRSWWIGLVDPHRVRAVLRPDVEPTTVTC